MLEPFNVRNVTLSRDTDIAGDLEIDSVAVLDFDHGNGGRLPYFHSDEHVVRHPHDWGTWSRRFISKPGERKSMDLFDKIAPLPAQHEQIAAMGRDPFGVCMDEVRSATEAIIRGKKVILAGSNNYLGLTFDPESISAAPKRVGTARHGNDGFANCEWELTQITRELETELASFFGCKSTLVFPTGYQANLGMISALAGPGDYILMDAHCHACIYGRMPNEWRERSFDSGITHQPILIKRLQRLKRSDSNKLIIVEGLYSMLGDIAPAR